MGLVTLQEAKVHLHRTDDNKDDLHIQNLINGISDYIEKTYCDRVFASASYTEYFSGDGESASIVTTQYPVTAVASLYDDTSRVYGASSLISASNYVIWADGRIELDGLVFSFGLQNVKITYTAGYSTIPNDLKLACLMILTNLYQRTATSISNPESFDQSIQEEIFKEGMVVQILDRYKRYGK